MAKIDSVVEVNVDGLTQKLENLLDDNTLTQLQTAFAETIDPWTPFLTGQLSNDITITSEGVTYNVPYAAHKYYGYAYHKEVHPLATSHWDKVAMEQGGLEILENRVKDILIARAKELYG